MYQRIGKQKNLKALAGHLVQVSAEVLDADNAVAQHLLVAGFPGSLAADRFEIAEFGVIGFLAVQFDVERFFEFGIRFFTELLNVFFRDRLSGSSGIRFICGGPFLPMAVCSG